MPPTSEKQPSWLMGCKCGAMVKASRAHRQKRRRLLGILGSSLETLTPSLTESEKASDSKGRGRGPVRISYRLRFRHRQRGLIWISGHQTAVNRDFRLLSRDL